MIKYLRNRLGYIHTQTNLIPVCRIMCPFLSLLLYKSPVCFFLQFIFFTESLLHKTHHSCFPWLSVLFIAPSHLPSTFFLNRRVKCKHLDCHEKKDKHACQIVKINILPLYWLKWAPQYSLNWTECVIMFFILHVEINCVYLINSKMKIYSYKLF